MNDMTTIDQDAELEHDPAEAAFARLEGEMALVRRAVQHLAAERADIVIPDYSPTLSDLDKRLAAISGVISAIADHPAMQLTPDSLAKRIEAAAETARRVDHDRINQAQADLGQAAKDMRSVVTNARTTAEQHRSILQAASGGALASMLLWAVLPGAIARSVPESWHWPERMATHSMGVSMNEAGARLLQTANPQEWRNLVDAYAFWKQHKCTAAKCKSTVKHGPEEWPPSRTSMGASGE